MFNSSVLDVGIGLIFVYLILGLMCTTVNEWIAQMVKMRAQTLKEGIRVLLHSPSEDADFVRPEDINGAMLVNTLANPNLKLAAALGVNQADIASYQAQIRVDEASLAQALAARINTALNDPGLCQKIDVATAAEKTLAAARKQSSGSPLKRANFALLREVYSGEFGGLAHAFYNHALVKTLAKPGRYPSYVPAHTFAVALMDILDRGRQSASGQNSGDAAANSLDGIASTIAALPESDIKRALGILLKSADNRLDIFQKNVETWFEDSMDRVSGWYKSKSQIITVVVAATITIFANADTVQIARKLFVSPVLREKIAREAAGTSQGQTPAAVTGGQAGATSQQFASLTREERADLVELTGWTAEFGTFHQIKARQDGKSSAEIDLASIDGAFPGLDLLREQSVFWTWVWAILPTHLLGWFLTAVAASLGAPFWFDTLNKFMNIRAAGTAPNEKRQDLSKT